MYPHQPVLNLMAWPVCRCTCINVSNNLAKASADHSTIHHCMFLNWAFGGLDFKNVFP